MASLAVVLQDGQHIFIKGGRSDGVGLLKGGAAKTQR
jgi:hypothetical protein